MSPTRARAAIVVTNTPDVLTESVADFTWALILAITRRLSEGERLVRSGDGRDGRSISCSDRSCAASSSGWSASAGSAGRWPPARRRSACASPTRHGATAAAPLVDGAERMSLDRLLKTSDIVSLHVPLTPETTHLIDKRALTRMKRSAYLINTARGPVVDEAALAWALQQHLLAGAALDVYENEPAVHPDLLASRTCCSCRTWAAPRPRRGRRWPISPSAT